MCCFCKLKKRLAVPLSCSGYIFWPTGLPGVLFWCFWLSCRLSLPARDCQKPVPAYFELSGLCNPSLFFDLEARWAVRIRFPRSIPVLGCLWALPVPYRVVFSAYRASLWYFSPVTRAILFSPLMGSGRAPAAYIPLTVDCIFGMQVRGEWRDRLRRGTRVGIGIGSAIPLKESATENSRKKKVVYVACMV
jgi:hypothetical protein